MNAPRLIGRVSSARPHVLLVTPPATPPWHNGSTLLARHLAASARGFHYRLLGIRGQVAPGPFAEVEPLFGDRPRGGWRDSARVFARILRPDRCAVHHFMFAPHGKAVRAVRAALTLSRKRSVHTIPSQPAPGVDPTSLLFADRTVVLSESSALLLRSAGADRVEVIRPAVPIPDAPADTATSRARLTLSNPDLDWGDAPVFVYPGDLEFSDGARIFVEAAALAHEAVPEARFALACRPKTPASHAAHAALKRRVATLGLSDVVRFLGVVDDMPALLGAATAVALPVDTLYAKVDIPIVLLEAMALGTPAVVSDIPSLSELAGLGQGSRVVKRSDPESLATTLITLAESASTVARLGRGARTTVESHFRLDTMAASYEAIYRNLGV
ncbi:MAG: glycosyltransferase family 4 protein [Myxococcota bacterium]|nr:glycosyltransferase family 4 protein [Myxococcota bacterium]